MANSQRSSSSPPRRPQAENRDFVTGLLRRPVSLNIVERARTPLYGLASASRRMTSLEDSPHTLEASELLLRCDGERQTAAAAASRPWDPGLSRAIAEVA